jgi:hypothetical protein
MLRCEADPRVISQVTAMLASLENASPFCKNLDNTNVEDLVGAGASTAGGRSMRPDQSGR